MLERISTEYVGIGGAGGARTFQTYEQWNADRRQADAASQSKQAKTSSKSRPASRKNSSRKFSYNEKREYEGMEEAILTAESEVERLESEAADPDLVKDHVRMTATYEQLNKAQALVKQLYARWVELEAIASGGREAEG